MKRRSIRLRPFGAVQPGFVDILTAAILLAILLWAAWRQFPAYNQAPALSPAENASPYWRRRTRHHRNSQGGRSG